MCDRVWELHNSYLMDLHCILRGQNHHTKRVSWETPKFLLVLAALPEVTIMIVTIQMSDLNGASHNNLDLFQGCHLFHTYTWHGVVLHVLNPECRSLWRIIFEECESDFCYNFMGGFHRDGLLIRFLEP